eukprot:360970-Chlamydomonas_euryale.AAC.3
MPASTPFHTPCQVEDVTGFPEMLDGRVKTLHPAVHGGILAIRGNESHMQAISSHNIKPIDLCSRNKTLDGVKGKQAGWEGDGTCTFQPISSHKIELIDVVKCGYVWTGVGRRAAGRRGAVGNCGGGISKPCISYFEVDCCRLCIVCAGLWLCRQTALAVQTPARAVERMTTCGGMADVYQRPGPATKAQSRAIRGRARPRRHG